MPTKIHINQHIIRRNQSTGEREHVISVKRGKKNTYASRVRIDGPSTVATEVTCG